MHLLHFLVNAAAGLALLAITMLAGRVMDDGCSFCISFLIFPIGGWLIGWRLPRGAPGASLAVAIVFLVTFPVHGGPTAKTLSLGFGAFRAGSMLLCEVLAASIELARRKKTGRVVGGVSEPPLR